MNKQELIKHFEEMEYVSISQMGKKSFIDLIEQLEEPERVKVSEDEAKFLETFDFSCESDVATALYHVSRTGWGYYLRDNNGIELKDLSEELSELEDRKRLIKAILDGYEVEKEKRYLVKIKATKHFFARDGLGKIFFSLGYKSLFTREELEHAGFGWVFSCEGIEIEEVGE